MPSNADMVVPLNEQLETWFLVWVFLLTKYITGVNLSQIGQREHWFSIFPSNCSSPRNFPRGPLYAYRCPGVTQKNSAKSVKKCSDAYQITVQPGCDKSPLHFKLLAAKSNYIANTRGDGFSTPRRLNVKKAWGKLALPFLLLGFVFLREL